MNKLEIWEENARRWKEVADISDFQHAEPTTIEDEIVHAVSEFIDQHGCLPGYVFVSPDKWGELLSRKPSVGVSLKGAFTGSLEVKRIDEMPRGSILPMPHTVDPRTWAYGRHEKYPAPAMTTEERAAFARQMRVPASAFR
ncbi:hypothetical protein [Halomonas elongata]|uniref:hypothetical protein n=1 Tax=Halomonas elongata TaxID=2746 RepID=UPI00186B8619|nr:hypothetical protein [Halomonas elongata]MBW5801182.1 hypothetical protein [Halomonas elongata]